MSKENDEKTEEINAFLKKHKYEFDYSFENTDSTAKLLRSPKYRINNDSLRYSYIQLRIYDSVGDLHSGYSICMGNFDQRKFIDSIPPSKNKHPFLNTSLKFENELDVIDITPETRNKVLKESGSYDYVFVVYYTIWSNYFSKHVLKEVSKVKARNRDKIMVILVNVARNLPATPTNSLH
jgi:hypothetical protein